MAPMRRVWVEGPPQCSSLSVEQRKFGGPSDAPHVQHCMEGAAVGFPLDLQASTAALIILQATPTKPSRATSLHMRRQALHLDVVPLLVRGQGQRWLGALEASEPLQTQAHLQRMVHSHDVVLVRQIPLLAIPCSSLGEATLADALLGKVRRELALDRPQGLGGELPARDIAASPIGQLLSRSCPGGQGNNSQRGISTHRNPQGVSATNYCIAIAQLLGNCVAGPDL